MRYALLTILLVAPLFGQVKTKYPVTVYSVNDGLAQSVVYCLLQDQRGYLWLGTQAGISQFDGKSFENFNTSHGLTHNTVRHMIETAEGHILFATENGVTQFDGSRFSRLPNTGASSPKSVRGLVQVADGSLWGASYDRGAFRYQDGQYEYFDQEADLPQTGARAITEDSQGRIWVGFFGDGVAYWENGTWRIVPTQPEQSDVRVMREIDDGNILIGTNTGLYIIWDGQDVAQFSDDPRLQSSITAITKGLDGSLWVGTNQFGVIHLNGHRIEGFDIDNGLSNNGIQSILQDNEQKMWFGTYGGGVSRLGRTQFLNITSQKGFAYDNVYAIYQDRDDAIWLGTNGGGLTRFRDSKFKHFTVADGLADDKILSIAQDQQGRLWVGTLAGANIFEGDRIRKISTTDGLPHNLVFHILPLADDRVMIATLNGLGIYQDGNITTLTREDGLNHNRINHIYQRRNGDIWLATVRGVAVYRDNKIVRQYTVDDGMKSDYLHHLLEDSKGRMWLASTEGLLCFEEGMFTHYSTNRGLSSPLCNVVVEDQKGMIWIGTANGLNRFDGQNFAIFSHRDGIPSNEINRNSGILDRAGNLWFGTTSGATRFLSADPGGKLPAPIVNITDVKVLGMSRSQPFDKPLEPWENYLEVNFNGISFSDAENIRFEYRLEGFDDQWISTKANNAVFLGLPSGEYRFSVKARNSDGIWSRSAAELVFEVKPPFWQKPWFIPSIAFLGITLVWIRLRQLRQRNLKLEKTIDERTQELKQLALWDQLTGARNRHYLDLIMPSEMAKLKRDFYASSKGFSQDTHSLGIAMLDIDHFKTINDSFGHEVGDLVLSELSHRLKQFIRQSDTLTRWGGEEFLLVLPRIDFKQLTRLCDRLRKTISDQAVELPSGKKIYLNISIGFTLFPLDHDPMDYDWRKLINLADIALYQAKNRGRNMVVGFNPEGYRLDTLFTMVETQSENIPDYMDKGFIINPFVPRATTS